MMQCGPQGGTQSLKVSAYKRICKSICLQFAEPLLLSYLPTYGTYPSRFSLSFGEDAGGKGIIGNPATYYFFTGVGAAPNADFAGTIPFTIFATFQLMFAIITPALITGSFAGESVRVCVHACVRVSVFLCAVCVCVLVCV